MVFTVHFIKRKNVKDLMNKAGKRGILHLYFIFCTEKESPGGKSFEQGRCQSQSTRGNVHF